MSRCGLDECDLYGGCQYDCDYGKEHKRLNRLTIARLFRAKAGEAQVRPHAKKEQSTKG